MSRPLRLELAGAVYHVTSRGDRQQAIFRDDTDRLVWLSLLANTCARFDFIVHSFCLMTNHYHLVIETGEANLSRGMRQLNGTYSQYFNRRHQLVGHLFQGRYKAIPVQKESHLLEVARYVVLNPIRAGMVSGLDDWRWSSFHYFMQLIRENLTEVTREHRRAIALSLAEYQAKYPDRDQAIAAAYLSTAYTMTQIAQHFRISYRTVSRVVRKSDTDVPVCDWQN